MSVPLRLANQRSLVLKNSLSEPCIRLGLTSDWCCFRESCTCVGDEPNIVVHMGGRRGMSHCSAMEDAITHA
eukprot:5954920-Pleurochrysis_carterae.AAC.1